MIQHPVAPQVGDDANPQALHRLQKATVAVLAVCRDDVQRFWTVCAHGLSRLPTENAPHIDKVAINWNALWRTTPAANRGNLPSLATVDIAGGLIDVLQVLQHPPAWTRPGRTVQRKEANALTGQLIGQQGAPGFLVDLAIFHGGVEAGPPAPETFVLAEHGEGRNATRRQERVQHIEQGVTPRCEDTPIYRLTKCD